MWFVEGYLIAVCGSFVVRFLVLLARFSFTEILQELRLGWKDYLKEDICWGGLAGLKYLFCFRLVGLENRDDRIRNLFLSHVRQRYPIPNDWRKRVRMDELPKEVKERALAMANAELSHELKLDEIEAIVRRVEQGKRVVRRASLATCLATWVASPLKMVTQLICGELPEQYVYVAQHRLPEKRWCLGCNRYYLGVMKRISPGSIKSWAIGAAAHTTAHSRVRWLSNRSSHSLRMWSSHSFWRDHPTVDRLSMYLCSVCLSHQFDKRRMICSS